MSSFKAHSVLPGFNLALGFTLLYLSLIVLIPLSSLFFKTATLGWGGFYDVATSDRVLASLRVTFTTSFVAAVVNAFFGLIVAWVLVRYKFPGKRIVDALVDLPFALPTALEQYDYAGATAIAVIMLLLSFSLLLAINALQWWSSNRGAR